MTQQGFKPSMDQPGGGTPLRKFRGLLEKYDAETRSGQKDGKPWSLTEIKWRFNDIDVIETEEPFPWPVATIQMLYTDPRNSFSKEPDNEWAHLSESLRKLNGGVGDIDVMVGKYQTWERQEAPIRQPDPNGSGKWVLLPGHAWKVVEIEGLASDGQAGSNGLQAVYNKLADYADGQTLEAFNARALGDSEITSNTALVTALTERTMVDQLVGLGLIERKADGTMAKTAKGG